MYRFYNLLLDKHNNIFPPAYFFWIAGQARNDIVFFIFLDCGSSPQ